MNCLTNYSKATKSCKEDSSAEGDLILYCIVLYQAVKEKTNAMDELRLAVHTLGHFIFR